MTYDQLQVGNVACFEFIARKLQHWEERYGERLQAACDSPHLAGVAEERRHFMGGELSRSAALVSPETPALNTRAGFPSSASFRSSTGANPSLPRS